MSYVFLNRKMELFGKDNQTASYMYMLILEFFVLVKIIRYH